MKLICIFILMIGLGSCRQTDSKQKALPYEAGGLRMEKERVALGVVYYGEKVRDTIRIRNTGEYSWEGRFNYNMHFMMVKAVPYRLEPQEEGMIIVEFDSQLYGKYDEYVGYVQCTNAGRERGMVYWPVTAKIIENFAGLTPQEKLEAPVVEADTVFDFGEVEAGEEVEWNVRLMNKGKKDLIIRNIKTTCGCTVAEPDNRVIAPGKKGQLKVTFRTSGKSGQQRKTIILTTNDYRHPQLLLTLTGKVSDGETNN